VPKTVDITSMVAPAVCFILQQQEPRARQAPAPQCRLWPAAGTKQGEAKNNKWQQEMQWNNGPASF